MNKPPDSPYVRKGIALHLDYLGDLICSGSIIATSAERKTIESLAGRVVGFNHNMELSDLRNYVKLTQTMSDRLGKFYDALAATQPDEAAE